MLILGREVSFEEIDCFEESNVNEKKVILKGTCTEYHIVLSGLKRHKINFKKMPAYFEIEIDLSKIKERKKNE